MASKDSYLLVAAIDFGTTFSGYAFSFKATEDNPDMPEKIRMNKNWGESLGFQSHKTPTSVLTTKAGDFIAFGYEAEQQYSEALEDEDEGAAADMLLFRHFKMMLHKREKITRTATIASVDGTIFPAMDIFAHAIRYLKDQLLQTLEQETGKLVDSSLIRWVITVPAIWSEESKQFMREAAYKSGCVSKENPEQLVIALEPEAASLCCRRLDIAQYSSETGVSFPAGTKYLVLDCGGGTIDITAHIVEDNNTVKELTTANGGPWGGRQVDVNFIDFLGSPFGVEFMNKYQQEYPQEWLKLVNEFDKMKKSLKPDGKSKLNISLLWAMTNLYPQLNGGKKIEAAIKEAVGRGVSFKSGVLSLKHEAAMKLFAPPIQNIIHHLCTLLKEKKLNTLDYILMVGGFSECLLLQDAIKKQFCGNGLKILIPSSAQLAIIKGAVLYGHYQPEISHRIARYTYGAAMDVPFDSKIHDPKQKFVNELGRIGCGVLAVYIEKGEVIEVGEKRIIHASAPPDDSDHVTLHICTMDRIPSKPVQYLTYSGIKMLGKITIKTPAHAKLKNPSIATSFEFGGTEIKVGATFVATGHKASITIDFLHD